MCTGRPVAQAQTPPSALQPELAIFGRPFAMASNNFAY
jgi:hypothetical protein